MEKTIRGPREITIQRNRNERHPNAYIYIYKPIFRTMHRLDSLQIPNKFLEKKNPFLETARDACNSWPALQRKASPSLPPSTHATLLGRVSMLVHNTNLVPLRQLAIFDAEYPSEAAVAPTATHLANWWPDNKLQTVTCARTHGRASPSPRSPCTVRYNNARATLWPCTQYVHIYIYIYNVCIRDTGGLLRARLISSSS